MQEVRDEKRDEALVEKLLEKLSLKDMMSLLIYNSPEIRKAGIPAYNWWNEGLHGAARSGTATVFPQAIGLAATFDKPLLEKIGKVVSTEQRAKYNIHSKKGDRGIYKGLTVWSPNINIFRDPRWGRGQETYGEDPHLTSRLAVSFIKGLQHGDRAFCTSSGVKHFAAHSGPEPIRHHFNAIVSQKDLEETYFPAFKASIVEAKAEGIMGAYTLLNGKPTCAHPLMDELVRGEWGFQGIFYSDCWAIRDFHEQHKITKSPEESAALALKAGLDLNCGCTYNYLESAYSKGLITREEVKRSARRALRTRVRLGLFDASTEFDSLSLVDIATEENKALSLMASRASLVLLENKDGFLPLTNNKKSIAVIGPNADSRTVLWGNYHGTSSCYTTVLQGIRKIADERTRVYYAQGSEVINERVERLGEPDDRIAEAVTMAEESDVVVLCLGLDERYEGEMHDDGNGGIAGDKKDLLLPPCQRKLLDAVAATGTPIVLVLLSGGSLDPEVAQYDSVKAVISAWYPGESGGRAVAELLFGLFSPSGKLPVTFYRNSNTLPDFECYDMKGRTYRYLEETPLYPFGHGLSYTKFHYENLVCQKEEEGLCLSFMLSNVGAMAGEEVSFVWAETENPDGTLHPKLVGFERTALEIGEKKLVVVRVPEEELTVVSPEGVRYHEKKWRLYVSGSQIDEYSRGLTNADVLSVCID